MTGEDGRPQPQQTPAQEAQAACVSWCQLQGDPHDACARELLRETEGAQPGVVMLNRPNYVWPNVVIFLREFSVILDLPTAQGVATVLAYLAPSARTAALGQALQRAASIAFPPLGFPEHGPVKGAHNPWRAGPRLGELVEGEPPAGV